MTVPKRNWLAAFALSLAYVTSGQAADPPPAGGMQLTPVPNESRSVNQQVADAIAANLRQSGQLRRYSVDIKFQSHTVEISGTVADQSQREEVLRIVQGVPGVERVLDRLSLASAVRPVAAEADDKQPPPALPSLPPPIKEEGTKEEGAKPPATGVPGEPAPIFQAPPGVPYGLNPPKMPPYAWPTYAPYNNYSRVACPTAYPYNAWPFIGPMYPFPKVPLGWRSVKLEFEDGYWWFSRTANRYDWWRVRYR